ncbi:hypothetical protein I552_2456 [Mycobacterium xenopi 3993]|nr:hypothetical protein I552_2456 [Mycobacterium xenopi 3993]
MLRLPRLGCSMKWLTPLAPATMPELIRPAAGHRSPDARS